MELIFASSNAHKVAEVRALIGEKIKVKSLADIGHQTEIPETASTIEGNALLKAQFIFSKFGLDCFADDTGLEVDALNNEPGVFSARYAGEAKDEKKNIEKLLHNLQGISNRSARFKTIICLILRSKTYEFEGIINGHIAEIPKGNNGFGYDSIFVADGANKTFAELMPDEKNTFSHRSIALHKLQQHLLTLES